MNYDEAIALANEALFGHYTQPALPPWFAACVTVGGFKNRQAKWVIRYTAIPYSPLLENQHWDEINGHRVVVEITPLTGERNIVISRPSPEPIVIFEVLIDPSVHSIEILTCKDLAIIDSESLEHYACPGNTAKPGA